MSALLVWKALQQTDLRSFWQWVCSVLQVISSLQVPSFVYFCHLSFMSYRLSSALFNNPHRSLQWVAYVR
jgi:hypothetical protein